MFYFALMFLIVGLVTAGLNLAWGLTVAVQIPLICFLIGLVLVAIHVIKGRMARVS